MYIHDEYKITNNKIIKVKGGAVDGHMGRYSDCHIQIEEG
jgi:hypothetical protein